MLIVGNLESYTHFMRKSLEDFQTFLLASNLEWISTHTLDDLGKPWSQGSADIGLLGCVRGPYDCVLFIKSIL